MKSPRHRWNGVAAPLRLEYQPDGFAMSVTPDATMRDLKKVVEGKGKNKAVEKALEIFRSDSGRVLYESILLATCDIPQAAEILHERPDHLKVYADCFFDISVFQSTGDKVVYLDKYSLMHPDAASIMRHAMQLSADELKFLANKHQATQVSPKTAIETGLRLFYWMMTTFIQPQLETVTLTNGSAEQKEHFDYLFNKAKESGRMVAHFSELLLKYELDKSQDNFLEEFTLALTPKPATELIADKRQDGDGPEIY